VIYHVRISDLRLPLIVEQAVVGSSSWSDFADEQTRAPLEQMGALLAHLESGAAP
jgi:hypothetical protein